MAFLLGFRATDELSDSGNDDNDDDSINDSIDTFFHRY